MTADPVEDYLATLREGTAQDARTLMALMATISGEQPRLWNVGTIGFGTYGYAYDSGRTGEAHALGFYPRDARTTIYLMDGTARHADALAGLGPHTTSRVCIYVKRLSDLDPTVLEKVLRDSYDYLSANDGHVGRA